MIALAAACVVGCRRSPQDQFDQLVQNSPRVDFIQDTNLVRSVTDPKVVSEVAAMIQFGEEIPMVEMYLPQAVQFHCPHGTVILRIAPGRLRYSFADYASSRETYVSLGRYFQE